MSLSNKSFSSQTLHSVWKQRIDDAFGGDATRKSFAFSSPNDLRVFYGKTYFDTSNYLFLIDYEIIGHEISGLDLIVELGIGDKSILVTSYYEDVSLREKCECLGIKIIPKSFIGFVPIVCEGKISVAYS